MRPDSHQLRRGTSLSSLCGASIASVTTAYNSAQELVRHIEALLQQERPLQEIIVVDNASTDETSSLVAARYPHVTLLRMAENRGTGGALATGLAYAALEKKHDWIWMFDQDSVPGPDALKLILDEAQRFDSESSKIGVLATLPVNPNMEVSSTPWLWRNRFVKPPAESLNSPILYADMVITSGSMVRRELIEKIGLPRSDFFIDFVDYEYCLRARSYGYKIVVITGAKLQHEVGKARTLRFLLGRQHIWSEHPPFREYYYSRNITYSVWWLYPSLFAKGFLLLHLMRHGVSVLLIGSEKLDCLRKMVQGFWDGRRASLGIRFRPDY